MNFNSAVKWLRSVYSDYKFVVSILRDCRDGKPQTLHSEVTRLGVLYFRSDKHYELLPD